jgi:hypothetical protein
MRRRRARASTVTASSGKAGREGGREDGAEDVGKVGKTRASHRGKASSSEASNRTQYTAGPKSIMVSELAEDGGEGGREGREEV